MSRLATVGSLLAAVCATPSGALAAPSAGVSVGGHAYFDADRDGVFGPFDTGQGIVQITLTGPTGQPVVDTNGQPVDPVATNADGTYLFDSLPLLQSGEHYTVTANEAFVDGTSLMSRELTSAGDQDLDVDFRHLIVGPAIRVWSYTATEGPAEGQHRTFPDRQMLPAEAPTVDVTFRIANAGDAPLHDVLLVNDGTGGGSMSPVACDFSALGGPASATGWTGPLAPGTSIECGASLSGLLAGESHESIATATASTDGGASVGEPPGRAGAPNTAHWYAAAATAVPATTTPATTLAPDTGILPATGASRTVALNATLLTLLGVAFVFLSTRRPRSRRS